jgi:hypothetical protein
LGLEYDMAVEEEKNPPGGIWSEIQPHIQPKAAALFAASVGDGMVTLFWTDRWLHCQSLIVLAPALISLAPRRIRIKRTVCDALSNLQWVKDIQGHVPAQALHEFMLVWDLLQGVHLVDGVPDNHIWQPASSGVYSSSSAYERFFVGATIFELADHIWHSWATPRCKYFIWLAVLNRCWTSDRLARRGLDHPDTCPLCDQADDTIQHLLVSCVFTRCIWFSVLGFVRLTQLAPGPNNQVFQD